MPRSQRGTTRGRDGATQLQERHAIRAIERAIRLGQPEAIGQGEQRCAPPPLFRVQCHLWPRRYFPNRRSGSIVRYRCLLINRRGIVGK